MGQAPYTHIGGMVVTDHGPVTLARAEQLARFYEIEAHEPPGRRHADAICAVRATALRHAAEAAKAWRRAAGWLDPYAADGQP
jgi:hypothetical protein